MEPIGPTVHLSPTFAFIDEGKPVRLDCVIKGQPKPEVIWYRNKKPIKETAVVNLLVEGDKCSLKIQEACPDHAGNYEVVAINTAGEASSSCSVYVTPSSECETAEEVPNHDDEEETEYLVCEERFVNQTAKAGETVKFEAVIKSEPEAWVGWYFNGKEITTRNDKFVVASTGNHYSLTIKKMSADTVGKVRIEATNRVGNSYAVAFLGLSTSELEDNTEKVVAENVEESEKQVEEVEEQCLDFVDLLGSPTAKAGESVRLEVVIKAVPDVYVEWYFKGQQVKRSNDNFVISSTGNHYIFTIIKMSSDTVGKLEICARNHVGVAAHTLMLGFPTSGLDGKAGEEQSRSQTSEVVDTSPIEGSV